MKIILDNLQTKLDIAMQLYYNDKSSISIVHNPGQHDKTKHITIDRYFIKDNFDSSCGYNL